MGVQASLAGQGRNRLSIGPDTMNGNDGRMRWRLGMVALALGAGLAGLAPYPLAATSAATALRLQIERATDFTADLAPGATFRLLPWPHLRFKQLVLRKSGHIELTAAAIEVPVARGWLAFLQRSLPEAVLIRPQFALNLDQIAPGLARKGTGSAVPSMPVQSFGQRQMRMKLVDAHITLSGSHLRWPLVLKHVQALYESRGMAGPAALRFSGSAAHGVFGGHIWMGNARSGTRPIDLVLTGPWAQVSTSGLWHAGRYNGMLAFSSHAPHWSTPFKGPILRFLENIGDFSFTAKIALQRHQIEAAHLHGSINGQKFRGLLALDRRGAADRLSGTLAARHVVLPDSILSLGSQSPGPADIASGELARRPLILDLRASVLQLTWHKIIISNLALALTANGGPMKFEIAQADLGGGTMRGGVKLATKGAAQPLSAALHLHAVDISEFCKVLTCPEPLNGHLSADTVLQVTPDQGQSLAATLTGPATFQITDGALPGPDLGRWLRWQARNQGAPLPLLNTDGTVFQTLHGHISFRGHAPAQIALTLSSSALSAAASGTLDPSAMNLDLVASARQTNHDAPTNPPQAPLAFTIKGPLTHPRLTPTMMLPR